LGFGICCSLGFGICGSLGFGVCCSLGICCSSGLLGALGCGLGLGPDDLARVSVYHLLMYEQSDWFRENHVAIATQQLSVVHLQKK
jgi:hypothetical protein